LCCHLFSRQFFNVDALINDREAPVSIRTRTGILLRKAVINVRDGFEYKEAASPSIDASTTRLNDGYHTWNWKIVDCDVVVKISMDMKAVVDDVEKMVYTSCIAAGYAVAAVDIVHMAVGIVHMAVGIVHTVVDIAVYTNHYSQSVMIR
jgi:hypothetical protein